MVTRRGLAALTAGAAALLSRKASACSYIDGYHDGARLFFQHYGTESWTKADVMLADGASLSIVRSDGQELHQRKSIISRLKMLKAKGYRIVGDTDTVNAGGMYWRRMGPWLASDLIPKGPLDIIYLCSGMKGEVYNVFVSTDFTDRISRVKTIMLLQSHELIIQQERDGEFVSDY